MLSVDDQILSALRRITHAVDVWSRVLLRDYGLTAPQLATLREILAGKNVSPVSLATALHLSQPTITGILKRLEMRGLISSARSSQDRRMMVSRVTALGRRLAKQAPPLLRDRFRKELGQISKSKQKEILTALDQVAVMMQAPITDEVPFLFINKGKT
jgi:DNA-binding MarR family transcriptional regulator